MSGWAGKRPQRYAVAFLRPAGTIYPFFINYFCKMIDNK